MTFLSPFFAVAGVLLVGIPVAIHLLNRRRYKVTEWAAMQFLLAAMKKNRRRLQFEQWLLLAVRCLLIGLMGLALARPAGCDSTTLAGLAGRSSTLHVIVLDTSYSMAYEADRPDAKTNFDQAKKIARGLIATYDTGGDAVVLITAGKPAAGVLAEPTYDLAAAATAVDRVPQTSGGTDLAGAFELARKVAESHGEWPTKTLDLISDATASAWRGDDATAVDAAASKLSAYRVRHFNVSKPGQINASVLDVSPAGGLVRTRFANDFRATARAFGGTIESSLLWSLGGESLPSSGAVSLDAQTGPQTQSNAQVRSGGPTVLSARIAVGDKLPIDDVRTRTVDVAAEMKVLIVEGRRGATALDGSGAFLELALAPPAISGDSGRASDSYIKADRISDIELGGKTLDDYRAVMMADVTQIAPTTADALKNYVRSGGTLVWFTGEQVQREGYNSSLAQRDLLPGPLAQRRSGNFTFAFNPAGNNDPLLAAFANQEKTGLDTAQTFNYWQVIPKPALNVRTVLAFAGKDAEPAVTVHRLGDGQVVYFASTADAEWTDFPAKPAYVALMHEILAGTVAGGERWMNVEVGGRVVVPAGRRLFGVPILRDPATQAERSLEQATGVDGAVTYQSEPVDKPGVYQLTSGELNVPISVNVPAAEADVRPVGDEAIRQAFGDVPVTLQGDEAPTAADMRNDSRDFGWSLMTIVLALLGIECFLAMRFGHYRR